MNERNPRNQCDSDSAITIEHEVTIPQQGGIEIPTREISVAKHRWETLGDTDPERIAVGSRTADDAGEVPSYDKRSEEVWRRIPRMTDQKRLHLQNKLVDMIILWKDIENTLSYFKKKLNEDTMTIVEIRITSGPIDRSIGKASVKFLLLCAKGFTKEVFYTLWCIAQAIGLSKDQWNWDLENMVERMVECWSSIEQVALTFTSNKLFLHKVGCWVCPAEAANFYIGGTQCRTTFITSTRTGKDISDIAGPSTFSSLPNDTKHND